MSVWRHDSKERKIVVSSNPWQSGLFIAAISHRRNRGCLFSRIRMRRPAMDSLYNRFGGQRLAGRGYDTGGNIK